LALLVLTGCAGPKYTIDDGRPVNPQLLDNIRVYGQGERVLRPAIQRSATLGDADCDHQWELPFTLASSKGWEEDDRVAWVRALGVDERLTVVATSSDSPLDQGEHVTDIDGFVNSDPAFMLEQLGRLRDRGRPFELNLIAGHRVTVQPFEVCRGYTRVAPPNSPELQDYHWLMSFHPLEVVRADLTDDEALWTVLWTQGVSEEGGLRMKAYHYGTNLLSSLYTVATLATGIKGAAVAAEAAINAAQQAATSVASGLITQQLVEKAQHLAVGDLADQPAQGIQPLTPEQIKKNMQLLAANRSLLSGLSRIAATVFERADAWAYQRMTRLQADPLAGFRLHQKLLERGLLHNAVAFDPERLDHLQALAAKDGRKADVVAILKGVQIDLLDFDLGDMPLDSAPLAFSYDELPARHGDPYAMGLVEAMLGMNDSTMPQSSNAPLPASTRP